jgi:hypothetical protein
MNMHLANARYNDVSHTTFDVDVTIDGKTFPFSYHPLDLAPVASAIRAVFDGGELSIAGYVAPTPELDDFQRAIETHIDAIARERGYSSGVSCASYVSSTNPNWQTEAVSFVAWRDAIWAYAFAQLVLIQDAERVVPTIKELIAELPVIEWPAT